MNLQDEVEKEIGEGMRHIFRALNISHNCAEEFCKQLEYEHNTLQQNFWRMMAKVIKKYSSMKYCDARNEASVEFCKRLRDFMEEKGFGYMPII